MNKLKINIDDCSKFLNIQLTLGKEYTRKELVEIVHNSIPLKQSSVIISEMIKDNVIIKKRNKKAFIYKVNTLPIYKGKIEKWINSIREDNKKYQQKSPEIFLKNLSTEDFINLIAPICREKQIKLLKPAGFNQEAILKLPPEILEKILKYEEI